MPPALLWPKAAFSSQKTYWPWQADTRANDNDDQMTCRRGVGKADVDRGAQKPEVTGSLHATVRPRPELRLLLDKLKAEFAMQPPLKYHRTPWEIRSPAPTLGQHNAEVFGKLGMSPARLDELKRKGVI